jgi:hypothetical protein
MLKFQYVERTMDCTVEEDESDIAATPIRRAVRCGNAFPCLYQYRVLASRPGLPAAAVFVPGPGPKRDQNRTHPAHPVHDHFPALDSGFRRNDVSYHAVFTSVMTAKPVPGVNREA